jgi:hypothetical protein
MCTTNQKCGVPNGFNPDAGAKFQPGDLVRIGNDKRAYPVLKCFPDYAELDAGEGSVYNISIGFLNKLSERSAVGYILNNATKFNKLISRHESGAVALIQNIGSTLISDAKSGNVSSKPQLGVIPRKFHEENRITALTEAINRYLSDGKLLPEEWVDELNELLYNRIDRKVEA